MCDTGKLTLILSLTDEISFLIRCLLHKPAPEHVNLMEVDLKTAGHVTCDISVGFFHRW